MNLRPVGAKLQRLAECADCIEMISGGGKRGTKLGTEIGPRWIGGDGAAALLRRLVMPPKARKQRPKGFVRGHKARIERQRLAMGGDCLFHAIELLKDQPQRVGHFRAYRLAPERLAICVRGFREASAGAKRLGKIRMIWPGRKQRDRLLDQLNRVGVSSLLAGEHAEQIDCLGLLEASGAVMFDGLVEELLRRHLGCVLVPATVCSPRAVGKRRWSMSGLEELDDFPLLVAGQIGAQAHVMSDNVPLLGAVFI